MANDLEQRARTFLPAHWNNAMGDWTDEGRREYAEEYATEAVIAALRQPSIDAWPKWVHDECLEVLRNIDTQFRATGQPSARLQRLIDLIAGMKPHPAPSADVGQRARELLSEMRDACAIASHGDSRESEAWKRYDKAEAELESALAQQPGAQGAVELGWVRRDAIRKLREDPEVTGVMVHADRPTDSVRVYLAPPALTVSDEAVNECLKIKWPLHYNVMSAERREDERRDIRKMLEYFARKAVRP